MKQFSSFLVVLFFSMQSHARDYFISLLGNNNFDGSSETPFLTIQHGLDVCQPGDTVQVQPGTYNEKLIWKTSGTPGHFVTLKSFSNGVIVDGGGISAVASMRIENKSYVQITGLTFQNNYLQDAIGCYVVGTGINIFLTSCIFRDIGWTTNPSADPFSVTPNGQAHAIIFNGRTVAGIDIIRVERCKLYNIITGNSEALTLVGNTDDFLFDRDTIYDTKNIAIDISGHQNWAVDTGVPDSLNQARNGTVSNCIVYNNRRNSNTYAPPGIYVDGGKNVSIINNRVYSNGYGLSIGCEISGYTTENITVVNNQIYNNDNYGLAFGSNQSTSIVKNCRILNNTFFKNGIMPATTEIGLQYTDSNVIANNIIIPRDDQRFALSIFPPFTTGHLTVTNNLAYRYSPSQANLYVTGSQFTAVNSVNADPVFIDTVGNSPNLDLSRVSPAIDTGNNQFGLITDKDARMRYRIINGVIDIGAFEQPEGGCPNSFTITDRHLLIGKFVARQNLILSRTQSVTLQSMLLWSSPTITVRSSLALPVVLKVDGVGCN